MENTQNLIGRKFKGFKFESGKRLIYPMELDRLINKELTINGIIDGFYVWVKETNYNYPLCEVLNHLIPEELQIPELPEGVLMLVCDYEQINNDSWGKRYVVGKDRLGRIWAFNENKTGILPYEFCKPIPKLPNYTLQELKEKIGHDFNLID